MSVNQEFEKTGSIAYLCDEYLKNNFIDPEASERLGVSKSHLVRTFTASVGVPPGKYLTTVRIEAAQRLLLHREYTLDVVASLCGFSGANYLCRVFKKETGQSPAQWRALTGRAAQSGLTPEETMREQEMYI